MSARFSKDFIVLYVEIFFQSQQYAISMVFLVASEKGLLDSKFSDHVIFLYQIDPTIIDSSIKSLRYSLWSATMDS